MKVWISKYALSGGITEHEAEDNHDGYVCPFPTYISFKLGRDAHTNRANAQLAAEAMRVKKIASLAEQIDKLEKLSFV